MNKNVKKIIIALCSIIIIVLFFQFMRYKSATKIAINIAANSFVSQNADRYDSLKFLYFEKIYSTVKITKRGYKVTLCGSAQMGISKTYELPYKATVIVPYFKSSKLISKKLY